MPTSNRCVPPREPLESSSHPAPASPPTCVRLRPDEHALVQGESMDRVLLLTRGELGVYVERRLVDIIEAPRVLEPAATMLGTGSEASYRALGPAEVTLLEDAESWSRSCEARTVLCSEVSALHRQRSRWVRTLDDFYEEEVGARIVPGPYRFGPFDARFVVMAAEPRKLRRLLPPGLHLLPGTVGRYLLVLADFENVQSLHPRSDHARYGYRETTPFIPVITHRGTPGLFVPELYPDAYMPILLGRETYGFPKRMGTTFSEGRRWDVVVGQRRILRARWNDETDIDPTELVERIVRGLVPALGPAAAADNALSRTLRWLRDRKLPRSLRRGRIYVRKRLLDHRYTHPKRYAVDELVAIPFEMMPLCRTRLLPDAAVDVDGPVLMGDPVVMLAARGGFEFGTATTVRRYRRKKEAA